MVPSVVVTSSLSGARFDVVIALSWLTMTLDRVRVLASAYTWAMNGGNRPQVNQASSKRATIDTTMVGGEADTKDNITQYANALHTGKFAGPQRPQQHAGSRPLWETHRFVCREFSGVVGQTTANDGGGRLSMEPALDDEVVARRSRASFRTSTLLLQY
jgi:hypothetical protein